MRPLRYRVGDRAFITYQDPRHPQLQWPRDQGLQVEVVQVAPGGRHEYYVRVLEVVGEVPRSKGWRVHDPGPRGWTLFSQKALEDEFLNLDDGPYVEVVEAYE